MRFWFRSLVFGMVLVLLISACTPAETPEPTSTQSIEDAVRAYTIKTVEAIDERMDAMESTLESLVATDIPTSTPTITPTAKIAMDTSVPPAGTCLQAKFIADITIPDETVIPPGSRFKKTWAIENTGSCAWDETYKLTFMGGDLLGAEESIPLNDTYVAPGEMVLVSVNMVAPREEDTYQSFWKIQNSFGTSFGVGENGEDSLFLLINVGNGYSFIDNLCSATWHNTNSLLFCPGKDDDPDGSFFVTQSPQLENGFIEEQPTIVLVPEQVENGQIYAKYAPIVIPPGTHLVTRFGCMYGNEFCNATLKITYQLEGNAEVTLGEWNERYDGLTSEIDINLGNEGLDDRNVSFGFYVHANGGPEDRVFLENPHLKLYE